MKNLNIQVSIFCRNGRGVIRLKGDTAEGGKFGREIELVEEFPLDALEQFILETKYEALHPPKFNIVNRTALDWDSPPIGAPVHDI